MEATAVFFFLNKTNQDKEKNLNKLNQYLQRWCFALCWWFANFGGVNSDLKNIFKK
jgi:hypothetical protein